MSLVACLGAVLGTEDRERGEVGRRPGSFSEWLFSARPQAQVLGPTFTIPPLENTLPEGGKLSCPEGSGRVISMAMHAGRLLLHLPTCVSSTWADTGPETKHPAPLGLLGGSQGPGSSAPPSASRSPTLGRAIFRRGQPAPQLTPSRAPTRIPGRLESCAHRKNLPGSGFLPPGDPPLSPQLRAPHSRLPPPGGRSPPSSPRNSRRSGFLISHCGIRGRSSRRRGARGPRAGVRQGP